MGSEIDDLIHRLFGQAGQPATAYQVTGIPRLGRRHFLTQLTSPLISAFHLGSRVFSMWDHESDDALDVFVGGTHGFPHWSAVPNESTGRLLLPPGSAAYPGQDVVTALAGRLGRRPRWIRIGGALTGFPERTAPNDEPETFEDHLAFLTGTAFTIVTIAAPFTVPEVLALTQQLEENLYRETGRAGAGVSDLAMSARQVQLAEATHAAVSGLWRIHAFVGAADDTSTVQVAALWSAATRSHADIPHRFAPIGRPAGFVETVRATVAAPTPAALASPFQAGTVTVAALCRPPLTEVPGVEARATNKFDVATAPGRGEVHLGTILDQAGNAAGPLTVPLSSFAKHTFVHGATGAGKSQATRHLLTEFSQLGIPWMVLEPAKSEYASAMSERLTAVKGRLPDPALGAVHVVRPGDPGATPVSVSPLQPEPGFNYQSHLNTFIDLAVAAFDADSPFPEVLTQAAEKAVRDAGWDPALNEVLRNVAARYNDGTRPRYPGVADLVRACHELIDAKGYSREVAANVRGFVDMRLGTLTTGTKRTAFTSGYPLSLRKCLSTNVVLELQDLGSDSDRALYMGLFLSRLAQAARLRHASDPRPGVVRNVIVVEEAHRLLRNPDDLTGAAARAVASFTDLLAEIRSQGVALVIAEQIPQKISPDVVKNTAIKCMGRTPAADDRDFVGAAIGLTDEQSRQVVSLRPGTFAVHTDNDDAPLLTQFPYFEETDSALASDPAPLVDDLPPWFGQAAKAGAATAADMARAAQLTEDLRWVGLVELTVLAHLTHRPVPVLDRARADHLLKVSGGTIGSVDAAIGTLVGAAVWGRRQGLGPYAPEALATEVAARVRGILMLRGAGVPDPRWRGKFFQLVAIKAALRDAPLEQEHPETDNWASWGLDYIVRAPAGRQLAMLRSVSVVAAGDREQAVFGTYPSALDAGLQNLGRGVDAGLKELLTLFVNVGELDPLRQLLVDYAETRHPTAERRA